MTSSRSRLWDVLATAALVATCFVAAGCDLPRDPEGTLDQVRGGTMRVGVIEQPPFAYHEDGEVGGIEATLAGELADQLGAEIEWTRGGEQLLFEKLERFELDLVIGGVTQSSPWSARVGVSLPHLTQSSDRGKRRHVFATPPGENGWLNVVDRFAYEQRGRSARLHEGARP